MRQRRRRREAADRVNQSERTITTDRGGFLGLYSGDNIDSIRGEAFHLAVLDEAAMLAPEAWTDAIMPTLADYDGDALLISTPKGRNWFFSEYMRAAADGKQAAAWQAPTSANPMPTIRTRRSRCGHGIRPHVSSRSGWLSSSTTAAGCSGACASARRRSGRTARIGERRYVMGIDWGRTNDATVFAVIDTTLRQQVYQDRMTATDYGLQMSAPASGHRTLQAGLRVGRRKQHGRADWSSNCKRDGFPVHGFQTTNASKAQIIDQLALAFERREIGVLPDETLLAELQAYESETLPGGMIRYGAPDGMHDDTVIALALAWHATTGSGPRARVREY